MTDHGDLMARISRAAGAIDPGLTDRDVERLMKRTHRKARRRVVTRLGFAATAVGAVGFAALAIVRTSAPPEAPSGATSRAVADNQVSHPASRTTVSAAPFKLADGSLATPLDGETRLTTVEDSARRVSIELGRGRARFEVVPVATRPFEVRAGDVTVLVVGTVFTVERVADRVGVAVERGTVRVNWGVGQRELKGGESGWFPPLQVKPDVNTAPGPATQADVPANRSSSPASSPASSRAAPALSAEQLLAAADTARLGGRPQEGVALLRRLLREHGRDARAPLAAFTLGRVLMMELGRPREAAAAFAQTRALHPGGPFAEDALAREIEAWSKVGDAAMAGARAREYLRRYPNGSRGDAVRTLGGIE